jgi:hypothetical protein
VRRLATMLIIPILCAVLLPVDVVAQERGRSEEPTQRGRTELAVKEFQTDEETRYSISRERDGNVRLTVTGGGSSEKLTETCLRGQCPGIDTKGPDIAASFSDLQMDLRIVGLPDTPNVYGADGRVEGVIEWDGKRSRFQGSATAEVQFDSETRELIITDIVITGIVIDIVSAGIVIRGSELRIAIDHVGAG